MDFEAWTGVAGRNGTPRLVRSLVFAGGAARFAIQKAITAEAYFHHGLAETAKLLAFALSFLHFTLGAAVFGSTGSGRHAANLTLREGAGNVPLLTAHSYPWPHAAAPRACVPYNSPQ